MCGIVGWISFNEENAPRELLASALGKLSHRGPDHSGVWEGKGCWLGHRRLAIIDLSEKGNQPMTSPDGRYVIVYNGEFYNYKDYIPMLEEKGYILRSKSDTEVLLGLYVLFGERALEYVNGMFALAIWDRQERKLFLARDRLGKKPLYYSHDNNRICFASEMKAIGALLKTRTLDAAGIDAYFSNGYVPSPLCIYREVRKLEASNFITVTTKSFRKVRYWKITAPEKQDATDESVQSLLEDSIRLRFVSDVPVGLLLSGGIDSSLITALAAGRLGKDFKSFSMAGGSGEYDERQYAAMVARNYGVELFTGAVEGDLRSHVERTAHYLDEPFADYSAIPTFLVSSLVSRHVKVAVSGEGGDELFGGYDKYVRWLKIKTFRKVPYTLRRILSAPGFKINEYKPSLLRSVVRLARHSINDDVGSFEAISSTQSPFLKEFSSKFNPEFAERFRSLDDMGLADFSLSKIMDIDRRSYLAEDLLFKVDRMSMANSLEIRCPFLDHRLVELSLRVKEGDMIKGNTNKIILRRLASRLLPSEIARRPKRGFSVPAGDWLKDQLEPMFREYVKKNDILSAIFDYKEIERLFEMHKRGSIELGNKLWAVFAFHLWWGYYGRGAGLEE